MEINDLFGAFGSLRQHLSNVLAPSAGLTIQWYPQWNPILDEAIHSLSGTFDYPLELYRLICQNPGQMKKRIGLISQGGEPVGIAGLRKNQHHWEPVTQFLLPGSVFPIQGSIQSHVLDQMGLDIWVGWWRSHQQPVLTRNVRFSESMPTYRMNCSADFEEFWRETGKFKSIRLSRNFTPGVNLPGAAEWTIRNWGEKWLGSQSSDEVSNRLLIAEYLEQRGLHHTITLSDQGEFVAGATMIVHHEDLVAGVLYRKPEYDWHRVNDRLIDWTFSWAAESKFRMFDLGGGQEYKTKWAPQDGERWMVNFCPAPIYHFKRMAHWLRRLKSRTTVEEST
jgi:hypothetical protein